jgi:hypothetical protein
VWPIHLTFLFLISMFISSCFKFHYHVQKGSPLSNSKLWIKILYAFLYATWYSHAILFAFLYATWYSHAILACIIIELFHCSESVFLRE